MEGRRKVSKNVLYTLHVLYVVRSNPNAGTGKAGLSRTARREKPTLLSRKVPKPNQKADNEPTREQKSKKSATACQLPTIMQNTLYTRYTVSPAFNTVKMAWVAGLGGTRSASPSRQRRAGRDVSAPPRGCLVALPQRGLGGRVRSVNRRSEAIHVLLLALLGRLHNREALLSLGQLFGDYAHLAP